MRTVIIMLSATVPGHDSVPLGRKLAYHIRERNQFNRFPTADKQAHVILKAALDSRLDA